MTSATADLGFGAVATPVYARALGAAQHELAPAVQALHCDGSYSDAAGTFTVRRGRGLVARALATALRLPAAGVNVPLHLRIDRRAGTEIWHRGFGDQACLRSSHVLLGPGHVVERVGRLRLDLAVGVRGQALELRQLSARMRVGAVEVPLPRLWCPRTCATAAPASGGQVAVTVQVTLPLGGLLVSYSGTVELLGRA